MSDEREALMDLLVEGWRKAETYFIETESDSWKWFMKDLQDALELTDNEIKYVQESCNAIGV